MTRLDTLLWLLPAVGSWAPLAWVLSQADLAQQVTEASALSFDGGEIALIGTMLTAVIGALVFIHKLLIRSKDERTADLAARVAQLDKLLTASSDRNRALQERMLELLATTLTATNTALAGFAQTVEQFGDGMRHHDERARSEHEAMLDMLTRLAANHDR